MANQTISVNRNFDDAAISGLANGEDITIDSGATLTINSDVRWGQQAAVIGNITLSSTTGGTCIIDARSTWWVPFSSSTGNVPSLGTAGTPDITRGGSNCGEFLGIFTALGASPSAAGGAMPSSGFIKMRTKSVTFAASDVLTFSGGATATLSGAGQAGWIHIVGEDQQTITVPRLGKFQTLGDWFYLTSANGSDDQQISIPIPDHIPAIQVETGNGTGVYEWWLNGARRWNTSTQFIPTDARGKYFGQWLPSIGSLTTTNTSPTVTGFTDTSKLAVGQPVIMSAGFANLSSLYIVSIVANTSVTLNANANATVSGTATMATIQGTTIEIARRASNSCGFKPTSGAKIRIPNILISNSITGFAGNILHQTIANRWEFVTTSAGELDINYTCGNWYMNLSAPYSVNIANSCVADSVVCGNTAAATVLNNVAIGPMFTLESTALNLTNLFSGLTLTDVIACRYASSSVAPIIMTDIDSPTLTRVDARIFGSTTAVTRGNADTRTFSFTRVNNFTMTDCISMGGKTLISGCTVGTCTGLKYADQINGTTVSNSSITAVELSAASADIVISGFSNFASIANIHPCTAIFSTATGCLNITIKDIGTVASKYNCGSANATGLIVSAAETLGLYLKRIYCENVRTATLSLANTVQNVWIDNTWGDLGDSQAIAALNARIRGCGWNNSVTGQTAVYGRHWEDAFVSTTAGRLLLVMNEPLASTASQSVVTAGTPKYTSTGNISMPTLGDQVEWEMPYFAIGHKSLANIAPTLTGTNTGNFTLEYQFQPYGGSYGGTWKSLTAGNLSGETIPAFVNLYNQGGFKLKIRATTATGNATNALTYIRIDTVTDSTEYARQYPYENPSVGYTSTLANSNLSIYTDSGDYLAATASNSAGSTLATPPWDANYTAILRLRKAGYQPIENTVTIDSDGGTIAASQVDYSTIPETDAGSLGITVTDHGASPVTWNSKQFSITIKTTNDSLTASQIANYINYNLAQFATFNGYAGLAWPEMVLPDGSNFQTSRGRLFGSAGASLKGVRVVRNDGTTAVTGFTQMQADDGTYWVAPVTVNVSNAGLVVSSKVQLYNVTTGLEVDLSVIGTTTYSYSTLSGTGITIGDNLRLTVTYKNGTSAKLYERQFATASSNTVFSISQSDDTVYNTYAIDGASLTGITFNTSSIDIEFDEADGEAPWHEIYAAYVNNIYTDAGIRNFIGMMEALDLVNFVFNSAIVFNNIGATPVLVGSDGFAKRSDDGSLFGTGNIQIDNSGKAYAIAVGSGVLPSDVTAIASAVWEESQASHLTSGTTGKSLSDAAAGTGGGASAADIWSYSTRELTSGAAPSASDIRQEIDSNSTKLDVAISTRLASASYTAPPSASTNASAVRTELTTELARIDATISSRNATAPDNASITAIKAKTDNLPASPASEGNVTAVGNAVAALNDITTAEIRTELSVELGQITAIKAKTDNLPSDPADQSLLTAAIDALPTASEIRTEIETTGGKIDKIDKKTNLIPALL